jgi:hypothetical protein
VLPKPETADAAQITVLFGGGGGEKKKEPAFGHSDHELQAPPTPFLTFGCSKSEAGTMVDITKKALIEARAKCMLPVYGMVKSPHLLTP